MHADPQYCASERAGLKTPPQSLQTARRDRRRRARHSRCRNALLVASPVTADPAPLRLSDIRQTKPLRMRETGKGPGPSRVSPFRPFHHISGPEIFGFSPLPKPFEGQTTGSKLSQHTDIAYVFLPEKPQLVPKRTTCSLGNATMPVFAIRTRSRYFTPRHRPFRRSRRPHPL